MGWDDIEAVEAGLERPVHYGCHEFRDDSERVIAGRAHPELERLYAGHLAFCSDCQRYHHRLEAVYRRPQRVPKVEGFAREKEFRGILERTRAVKGEQSRGVQRFVDSASVGMLSVAATVLVAALAIPSVGDHLFGDPIAHQVELSNELASRFDDAVQIPTRRSGIGHQAQSFGRIIGGDAQFFDDEGNAVTGDSLTVGTQINTGESSLQVALLGRLLANFQPQTTARWHAASPSLVEVGLVSGTLAIRYDRQPDDPILQVRTPTALVRVVGTVFTVHVDDFGNTSVAVLRGKVEVLDPIDGRSLGEVEAGFDFDVEHSTYRDVGRREVAAALPLSERSQLVVAIAEDGDLIIDEANMDPGQIPQSWTVPGLSDDPGQRTLDRVFSDDVDADALVVANATRRRPDKARNARNTEPQERRGPDQWVLDELAEAEAERSLSIDLELERCRDLYADGETRFRAARCLSDFMKDYGREPEAVEGLLLLGTLRMDFAHDYQSATRNIEEFLRRAPSHPKAELARYQLVLAAIDAGYIDRAISRSRHYLSLYPDGQYVGRILQRFPELKSAL